MLDLIQMSNGMVLILLGLSTLTGLAIGMLLIIPEVVRLQSVLRNGGRGELS